MLRLTLQYGITRTDLPEPTEKPKTVVFCDIGHSDLCVLRRRALS